MTALCRLVWGPPPASKEEARLILKIDVLVLTFTCLMYWSNYLSRTNFQFAYVSGMKEDLGFQGNQYSISNTLFTVGYIIGMIPNILILQVLSPHHWLPFTAATWAGLAMCLAAAKTPGHVMGIRFLQGVFESSTFAGTHYILGSWYTDTEIGKRSGIFASSAQLGSLFSGVLQGSIQSNLQGRAGLRAWQWQFLFDGFIGLPIAAYGWLFFPDVPRRARQWILTPQERKMAIDRLPQRQQSNTVVSWSLLKRVLGRWHWYGFSALFAWSSMLESIGSNGLFQLWLAAEGYPFRDRNYWPLALQAVAIFSTVLAATLTDIPQIPRWAVNPVMAVSLTFVSIVLLIWKVPFSLKFAAFALGGMGYAGQASNFSWANVVCAEDEQERAIVLASMNLWSNVVQSWWSIVFYPAVDAPRFHRGFVAMICVAVATVAIALVVRHLDLTERKKKGLLARGRPGSTTGGRSSRSPEKLIRNGQGSSRRATRSFFLGSPLLALVLSPLLCALASAQAEPLPDLTLLNDEYHETLHLRPLPTGRVQSLFTFKLSSTQAPFSGAPGEGNNFQLLSASLLSILEHSDLPMEELSISFNKGRWDYERWGMPSFADVLGQEQGSSLVANGAEVWARYAAPASAIVQNNSGKNDREDAARHHPTTEQTESFHDLLSILSGQFCSTLAAGGSKEAIAKPSNLTREFFSPRRSTFPTKSQPDLVLQLSLPPSPCTEVLHPFLALLPCKRTAGLASLLGPHHWLSTEWHGIDLNVRRSEVGGVEVTVKVGSVWNGVSQQSKRDFSLSSIFGTSLKSSCPLASTSDVILLAPPGEVVDFVVDPLASETERPGRFGEEDIREGNETEASAMAERLRREGQISYDVSSFFSLSTQDMDVSLRWPEEERFNYTSSSSLKTTETLHVKRSFISSTQLDGILLLTITNDRMDRSRRVVYRDILPWFLSLNIHSAQSDVSAFELPADSPFIRFESDVHGSPVRKVSYTEGIPRQRPEVLELELLVPPKAKIAFKVSFDKHTIRYEEHPPDAHRGLDVGAATVWEIEDYDEGYESSSGVHHGHPSSTPYTKVLGTWKTEVALIEVAVPDFSMPYNVVIFTSTILALFTGSAINLLTRRFVDVIVPGPELTP